MQTILSRVKNPVFELHKFYFQGKLPCTFSLLLHPQSAARPHNSPLRSESFAALRPCGCAVRHPADRILSLRGNPLFSRVTRTLYVFLSLPDSRHSTYPLTYWPIPAESIPRHFSVSCLRRLQRGNVMHICGTTSALRHSKGRHLAAAWF